MEQAAWLELPGHKCVLGISGSGKSFLVKAALARHAGGALVVDTQEELDWPCTYLSGEEDLDDIYRALRRGVHLAYVPDKELAVALSGLKRICTDLIEGHWGNLWFVVDEAQTYAPKKVPSPLTWIALRGRTHEVKGIWITQRPAELSHTLLTQVSHHAIFDLSGFEDPYLARYHLSGESLRERIGPADSHAYLLWDKRALSGPFVEAA